MGLGVFVCSDFNQIEGCCLAEIPADKYPRGPTLCGAFAAKADAYFNFKACPKAAAGADLA
jgi:hypothetical protein